MAISWTTLTIALLVLVGVSISFSKWRWAWFFIVLVAAMQDPLRKLTVGVPAMFTLATVPLWGALIINGKVLGRDNLARFREYAPGLNIGILCFAISIIPAALLSATYGYNTWMVTALGIGTYGGLIVLWMLGFHFVRNLPFFRKAMAWYCIVTLPFVLSAVLQYWDVDIGTYNAAIGSEVLGREWIRYLEVTGKYDLILGFYRSPDLMGWHALMVTCLSMVLFVSSSNQKTKWLWLVIGGLAGLGVVLCGRRKILLMLPIFVLVWVVIYSVYRKDYRWLTILFSFAVVTVIIALAYFYVGLSPELNEYYFDDASSNTEDRFWQHNYDDLLATYHQAGFWGHGLGFGSQGVQHVTQDIPPIWQEGGISRFLVELGIPGLLGFIFMGITVGLTLLKNSQRVASSNNAELWVWNAALLGLLAANVASFVVSHQIYGDFFVLGFFALLTGAAMGLVQSSHPMLISEPTDYAV